MKERIKLAISKFSRLISDAESKAKEICDVKDLTSSQINYLETINELGNPSITELSSALGVKKPSVTVAVDRLITKGCIYKTASDADRRSSHLHLTDVGNLVNQRHDFAHDFLADLVRKSLTEEEQEAFVKMVDKLSKAVANGKQ